MAMKLATTVGEKFDLCQILSLFYFYSIIHLEQAAKKQLMKVGSALSFEAIASKIFFRTI